MSWEDILKGGSKNRLSALHHQKLKKAIIELSDTHSNLLENASNYKDEIIDLATSMYMEETGKTANTDKGHISAKYKRKFRTVIGRIVNTIKRERNIE